MSPLYLLLFLTAATVTGDASRTAADRAFEIARIMVDEIHSLGASDAFPSEDDEAGSASEDSDAGDGDDPYEATACDGAEGACEGDELEELIVLEEEGEQEIDPERRYTADLSDEELQRLWLEDLEALGTISMGFAHAGRLINAVQFPQGDLWTVVSPRAAWTVSEVVEYVTTAIRAVEEEHPGSPKLRVNHLSSKDGGPLRPHASHQNGRDVDLAFYYKTDVRPGFRGRREHLIDAARNWSLVKALATKTDVQVILVDNRIQRVIYNHALSIGEDREWLDSLFGFRGGTLLRHARRHYDHYHVRFYAPRSQELGRRVQPLLAQRPEENRTVHRVRRGDTLGHIARRYGTSVKAIMRANNMRRTLIHPGRNLVIPLRKPCTICPLPPIVEVPPRRLPPTLTAGVADQEVAAEGVTSVDGAVADGESAEVSPTAASGGGDSEALSDAVADHGPETGSTSEKAAGSESGSASLPDSTPDAKPGVDRMLETDPDAGADGDDVVVVTAED